MKKIILLILVVLACVFISKKLPENAIPDLIDKVINVELPTLPSEEEIVVTKEVNIEITAAPEPEPTTLKAPDYVPDDIVTDLFDRINDYREENGRERLIFDDELGKVAYVRAMEQEQKKGHTRPNGTSWSTALKEYGYVTLYSGENIAICTRNNYDKVLAGWQGSPGHNENMLKPEWKKAGLALFITEDGRYCFVNLFSE